MSTSRATILKDLNDIVRKTLGWSGELRQETRLVEDLELDSMRLFTLAVEIEDHFQIALSERDEGDLATVTDLVDLVESKLAT